MQGFARHEIFICEGEEIPRHERFERFLINMQPQELKKEFFQRNHIMNKSSYEGQGVD